jgi:hypothetical protein
MAKVQSWTPEQWRKKMEDLFSEAKAYRAVFENTWAANIRQYAGNLGFRNNGDVNITFDNLSQLASGSVDSGDSAIGINYIFKYTRFVQSQLSANPPSVIIRPATTDAADRQKADAADRVVRNARDTKDIPEEVDMMNLSTLVCGIGCIKVSYNKDKGEVQDFDESSGELQMTGEIEVHNKSMFDLWLDPKATSLKSVRHVFERELLTIEEANYKWPEFEDKIKENQYSFDPSVSCDPVTGYKHAAFREPMVEVFHYVETASPVNGMAGRYACFLGDYTFLDKPCKNPHPTKGLPYKFFTYVDIPGSVYAKSVAEYAARIQDMLNRIDSNTLDAIQAHNVVRMVVPDGADISDDDISNSSWDWVKVAGVQDANSIRFVNPPSLMPDAWQFRDSYRSELQDLYGINDSMLGIQQREQSAVSQQTAIQAGTAIHRRLLKKYETVVREIYKDYLELVKQHWTTPHIVQVIGKDKAFESVKLKGADIAGGYDIIAEYGTSLPIDPNMRREAIMLMMPMFEKAGIPQSTILKHLKLDELETLYDINEMAADRQMEDFEEMVALFRAGKPTYIPPKEMQQHVPRLAWAKQYLETSEFKYLEPELQDLIRQHIKEREQLLANEQPAAAPAPTEIAGMPGVDGAMDPGAAIQQAGIV